MTLDQRRRWTRRSVLGKSAVGLGGALAATRLDLARALAAQESAQDLTTEEITLAFMGHVAGGDREEQAYQLTFDAWHEQHPNIRIEHQIVPDPDRIARAQARVAAGEAPDLWRHNHDTVRLWAAQGHLLDLTDLMPENYQENFLPALMATCLFDGRVFGLPHTTDTSSLFYRADALAAIGVEAPASLEEAWTWDEFGEICNQLIAQGNHQFAFTHNQGGGRWVPSFLYSAGAQVVNDDLTAMATNTPEGIRALSWVKGWTDNGWVSPGIWDSTNPNESSDEFIRGTAAMAIVGQWNITYLDEQIGDEFEWGVTFLPFDKEHTTSLGGTPIVASATTQYPREVAAFMEFFTSVEMMRMFDEMANYMPVRNDLFETDLEFEVRSDLMQVFHEQMPTLPQHFVEFVARSYSSGVSAIIDEEMSQMIFAGTSPEETAANMERRGNEYIQANPDVEDR